MDGQRPPPAPPTDRQLTAFHAALAQVPTCTALVALSVAAQVRGESELSDALIDLYIQPCKEH